MARFDEAQGVRLVGGCYQVDLAGRQTVGVGVVFGCLVLVETMRLVLGFGEVAVLAF